MDNPAASGERYGRLRALLHWMLAILITAMLAIGFLVIAPMAGDNPAKAGLVRTHMIIGILIFIILHVTIPLALRGRRPAPLSSGSPGLALLAKLVHHGLRFTTVAIILSGLVTAKLAGLPEILFLGQGDQIPAMTRELRSFKAHGALALVMVGLLLLHIAGALFHALVRRDGIFSRISIFKS